MGAIFRPGCSLYFFIGSRLPVRDRLSHSVAADASMPKVLSVDDAGMRRSLGRSIGRLLINVRKAVHRHRREGTVAFPDRLQVPAKQSPQISMHAIAFRPLKEPSLDQQAQEASRGAEWDRS